MKAVRKSEKRCVKIWRTREGSGAFASLLDSIGVGENGTVVCNPTHNVVVNGMRQMEMPQ